MLLNKPLRICGTEVKNRIVVPPMSDFGTVAIASRDALSKRCLYQQTHQESEHIFLHNFYIDLIHITNKPTCKQTCQRQGYSTTSCSLSKERIICCE